MTSKEALDRLNYECIHSNGYDDESSKELNIIRKDLEVLDILKRSIFNKEEHKYVLTEKFKGQKFMIIGLIIREEDYINKIIDIDTKTATITE